MSSQNKQSLGFPDDALINPLWSIKYMNKDAVLAVKNVKLFPNQKPSQFFFLNKEEKVMADYTGYDLSKGYNLSAKDMIGSKGTQYVSFSFSLKADDGSRETAYGKLFAVQNPTEKGPTLKGVLQLTKDSDGPKLNVSAWKKTGKESGKEYLSLAFSPWGESKVKVEAAVVAEAQEAMLEVDPSSIPF